MDLDKHSKKLMLPTSHKVPSLLVENNFTDKLSDQKMESANHSFGQMPVGQMSVGQMSVGQMSVGQMSQNENRQK